MSKSTHSLIICVLASSFLCSPANALVIRSADGSGNNLANPDWGKADTGLIRLTPAAYADGQAEPRGGQTSTLPSARAISNAVSAQSHSIPNKFSASDWLWQWGQFIDHDLDLTPGATTPNRFDIAIPVDDVAFNPFADPNATIPFQRSLSHADGNGVEQQVNEITAYIDGSNVYGSDAIRATVLRSGGSELRMSTGNNGEILMGLNTIGAANDNGPPLGIDAEDFYLAGDVRANEQIGLTAVHTVFAREHNRLVDDLKARLGNGDAALTATYNSALADASNSISNEDDFLYEAARKVVAASIQKITYKEFLPVLLGVDLTETYGGYDETVNAGISNEFSTAAFRLGHTLLPSDLLRINPATGEQTAIPLRDAFFNPGEVFDNGVDSLLLGLSKRRAEAIDTLLVDDVRNFLFGPPGAGGLDLAALNIQRGRDHGIGSLNSVREALGLDKHEDFLALTGGDVGLADQFASIYDDIEDVDLWIGGLAEGQDGLGMLGETFRLLALDQFMRTMLGDRFFFLEEMDSLNVLAPNFMADTSLANIILRNSSITSIQKNVFLVVPEPISLALVIFALWPMLRRRALPGV